MPKLTLEPSAESFLKGIQNRKAQHEATLVNQATSVAVPTPPVITEENAVAAERVAEVTTAPAVDLEAPIVGSKAPAEKPKKTVKAEKNLPRRN